MAELHIDTQVVAGVQTISLGGDLDSYSAPRVRHLLETLTSNERPAILIHLAGLEYLDSTGLGVLVAALKQASDHSGVIALAEPPPAVERALRITGLDKIFLVFSQIDQAQERLHALFI